MLGPQGFPLRVSFSSGEATLGPLTSTGAEFEEFATVAAYDIQSRVFMIMFINLVKKSFAQKD